MALLLGHIMKCNNTARSLQAGRETEYRHCIQKLTYKGYKGIQAAGA
jgi:hypothetical protein